MIIVVFVSIFSRIGCVLGGVLSVVGCVVISCGGVPQRLVGMVSVLDKAVT